MITMPPRGKRYGNHESVNSDEGRTGAEQPKENRPGVCLSAKCINAKRNANDFAQRVIVTSLDCLVNQIPCYRTMHLR